jgi:hypothetical protein
MSKRINLGNVSCYDCGSSLEKGDLIVVTETPLALVAHVTCPECEAQSMVTVTPSGVGSVPMVSDLVPQEIKRFLNMDLISQDEILDLHEELKGTNICNLMQQKENNLGKKQKKLDKNEKSRQ